MAGAWSVSSLTRVRAAGLLWERAGGAWFGTVVCKATFGLRARSVSLTPEQDALLADERPFGDGSSAGLGAPPDLVPLKARVDVVLVGHAAPAAPCRQTTVRFAIGDLDKRVDVWTDRLLLPDGTFQEAQPFTAMPLVYERAAAGPGLSNPLGVRHDARDAYGRRPVPNLVPAGSSAGPPSRPIMACFAPIPATWPRRAELAAGAGRLPDTWDGAALPRSVDPQFFNVAPPDQQLESLALDAPLVLENLVPGVPAMTTRLPGFGARAFVWGRREPFQVPMRLDTACVFASRAVLTLTFRVPIPLASRDEPLEVVVGLEDASRPLTLEEVSIMRGRKAAPPIALDQTTAAPAPAPRKPQGRGPTLPFAITDVPAPTSQAAPPSAGGLPFASAAPASLPPSAQAPAPVPSAPLPVSSPPAALTATALSTPAPSSPLPVSHLPGLAQPADPPRRPSAVPPPLVPTPALSRSGDPLSPWAGGAAVEPHERLVYTPVQVTPDSPSALQARPSAPLSARSDMLVLSGVDSEGLACARRDPTFQQLLTALADAPLDGDLDDPDSYASPEDMEDHREAAELLANGPEIALADLGRRLADHILGDGRTLPPAALLSGELTLPFDALARLRATLGAALPCAGADAEALALVETARAYLASPGLPGAAAVADGLVERILDTFNTRGLATSTSLRTQAERLLLAERAFDRKTVLGAPHTRAELRAPGSREPVTVYLPRALAEKVPSAPRFPVKLLATVHPSQDPLESQRVALRAAAIALLKPIGAFSTSAASLAPTSMRAARP